MAAQVSVSTFVSVLAGIAAIAVAGLTLTNAWSSAADARQECKLEVLRTEVRCKDACMVERGALLEKYALPNRAAP